MAPKVSVFIGSSSKGKPIVERLTGWFRDNAGELDVEPWTGAFTQNESYLDSLIKALRRHDFAILVATADDPAEVRDKLIIQARDNVIFEYGLFMGKLGRGRTFLAYSDSLQRPTDLDGITGVPFNQDDVAGGDAAALGQLGQKLRDAIEKANDDDGGFFVLFPSLQNDPFYLDLLAGIASPTAGTRDVTFQVPSKAYSGQEFLERLDVLASKQGGFRGGLIAPTLNDLDPDHLRKSIAQFRIPIVLVDINPFEGGPLPDKTFYVGVDNFQGGKLAGSWMRAALDGVTTPRVLALCNRDQPKRLDGFLDGLGSGHDIVSVECRFSAQAGRDATIGALRNNASFHAIFAVSDEIALGAIDALSIVGGGAGKDSTIVVGFDGTPVVRTLIDLKISPLRATVKQNAYLMGERAMNILRQEASKPSRPNTRREELVRLELHDAKPGPPAPPARPVKKPAARQPGSRRKSAR